jgi:hypothetical protein
MKNNAIKFFSGAFIIFGLIAPNVQAQGKLTNLNFFTVSFSLQSQGSISDDGTTRIFANTVSRKIDTKDLLNQLARDKYAQGSYTANFFPSGSQLALSGGLFIVVDRNDQLIVDVSDILQFFNGTNEVLSGKINDTTGLASPKITDLTIVQLTFDDTFIPGGGQLNFSLQGLDMVKIKDTSLITGGYTEASSDNVKNITGAGQINGIAFIVAGSMQGSRSEKLAVP